MFWKVRNIMNTITSHHITVQYTMIQNSTIQYSRIQYKLICRLHFNTYEVMVMMGKFEHVVVMGDLLYCHCHCHLHLI